MRYEVQLPPGSEVASDPDPDPDAGPGSRPGGEDEAVGRRVEAKVGGGLDGSEGGRRVAGRGAEGVLKQSRSRSRLMVVARL